MGKRLRLAVSRLWPFGLNQKGKGKKAMRVPRAVWLLLCLGVLVALLLAGFMSGELGTYDGLNKGVYVRVGGPVVCGVEVVGSPGVFCNDEG